MQHKKTWTEMQHDILIEIVHHAEDNPHINSGRGIWCGYLYIYESKTPKEIFDRLWLEDKTYFFNPKSPGRITHDYYELPILSVVDFHGGITYYDKRGQTEGHRCVIIGCDYNHLGDDAIHWSLDIIFGDLKVNASQARAWIDEQIANLSLPTP